MSNLQQNAVLNAKKSNLFLNFIKIKGALMDTTTGAKYVVLKNIIQKVNKQNSIKNFIGKAKNAKVFVIFPQRNIVTKIPIK